MNPNQGKTKKITSRNVLVKLLKNQDKQIKQNKRTNYIQENNCIDE